MFLPFYMMCNLWNESKSPEENHKLRIVSYNPNLRPQFIDKLKTLIDKLNSFTAKIKTGQVQCMGKYPRVVIAYLIFCQTPVTIRDRQVFIEK